MTSKERIITPTIAADGSRHYQSVTSPPDDSIAVCYMIPDRIIPIVFVPGVMGTNLEDLKKNSVWLVNSSTSLLGWIGKSPIERKKILDPEKTRVSHKGDTPAGTALSPDTLQARGWRSISKMFYGDFLVWLENALNDCNPGTDFGKNGLRAQLEREEIAPGLEKLTKSEVDLSYKYLFPVHAVGYNWLQSNAISGDLLGSQIKRIIEHHKKDGMCEKVIVVTHSMGGLVARYCCASKSEYRDSVLGIVHGVMPATGSATAYRRVKAGTEPGGGPSSYGTSLILGNTSAKVMPVFAQSPGPLQLLPSPDYGQAWLQIKDGERFFSLPKTGNPYEEIYLVKDAWWGLVDEKLIDPEKYSGSAKSWSKYRELISKDVRQFHQAIKNFYHPITYTFWGEDEEHKTWGNIIWKRTQFSSLWNDKKYDVQDKATNTDSQTGLIDVVAGQFGLKDVTKTFELQPADEDGDGTVPARSGRAPKSYSRRAIAFKSVDHGTAYKKNTQRNFTLWAIVKIVQSVKGTTLEYRE